MHLGEETKQIIANSVQLFRERYVTPAAEACYWRELFKRYREVSYEPEAFATKTTEKFGKKEEVLPKIHGRCLLKAPPCTHSMQKPSGAPPAMKENTRVLRIPGL